MSHCAQQYRFNSYGKLCYGDTILSTNWSFSDMKQLLQAHMACTWPSWDKYSHWTAKLGFFHLMLISCPILPSPMVHKQRAKQGNQNIDNLLSLTSAVKDSPKRKRAYGHSQSLPAAPMEASDYSLGTWQVHSEDLFSRLLVKLHTSSKNHRNWSLSPGLSYSALLPLDSIFLWPCELPCIMFHSELSNDSMPESEDVAKEQTAFTLEGPQSRE